MATTKINGTGNVQDELNRMSPAASHAKLGDLLAALITQINDLTARANNRMLTKAGLVIKQASSPLVRAASAFAAVADGVVVRKAASTDMAALAGTLATANSALWAFYIDSAGTLTTSTKTASVATHALAVADLPAVPAGLAMIGFIVIDNATGSNFVGGTTALDTGSLTVTYYDTLGEQPFALDSLGDLNSR